MNRMDEWIKMNELIGRMNGWMNKLNELIGRKNGWMNRMNEWINHSLIQWMYWRHQNNVLYIKIPYQQLSLYLFVPAACCFYLIVCCSIATTAWTEWPELADQTYDGTKPLKPDTPDNKSEQKVDSGPKVNCRVSDWSIWSPCSASCGNNAYQYSRRIVQTQPRNGGRSCPGKLERKRRCRLGPCGTDGSFLSCLSFSSLSL